MPALYAFLFCSCSGILRSLMCYMYHQHNKYYYFTLITKFPNQELFGYRNRSMHSCGIHFYFNIMLVYIVECCQGNQTSSYVIRVFTTLQMLEYPSIHHVTSDFDRFGPPRYNNSTSVPPHPAPHKRFMDPKPHFIKIICLCLFFRPRLIISR